MTADAMSCQKETAKKISSKQADYVLSLKENQPTFRHEAEEYFEDALKNPQQYPKVEIMRTKDSGHGRAESRSYYLSAEVDWHADKAQWENFRSIGMVCSRVECNGEISTDTRYFISSLSDVQIFSKAVRKHRGIENSLHRCLDMTFREDYSRIRKDHSAENMAVVRHIALNILKNHPSKISLAGKRRRCS